MTISTAEALESADFSEFTAAAPPAFMAPALPAISEPSEQLVRIERAATAKRRARVDWYTLGIILLILASGAVCIYRLAWAMQP